jgi:MATE family multidrug resistance protein
MNLTWQEFKGEQRRLFRLALPILIAQLALTGLGVVDTLMSSWVGTTDLAAIGLGSSIMLPVFILATTVLIAITPLVAHAREQSNHKRLLNLFCQSVWVALPSGLIGFTLLLYPSWLLDYLSLNAELYALTKDYLFYVAFGMPAIAFYQGLRFYWEGMGTSLPTMWISLFALALNIPLNALFIYGGFGIEAFGAAGCGIATALVMWTMLVVGLAYVYYTSWGREYLTLSNLVRFKVNMSTVKSILVIGIPAGLAILFEVTLFTSIALFIAPMGEVVLAAHQIAMNVTSLLFMIPLSLGLAISISVGSGLGSGNTHRLRVVILSGLMVSLMIGLLLSFTTLLIRFDITNIYTREADVFSIAVILFLFAAAYQIFDAIQVMIAGILRGLHESHITMWITLFSYWFIGLGIGFVVAYTNWLSIEPIGVYGFWLGIVIGLALASLLLILRLKYRMKKLGIDLWS